MKIIEVDESRLFIDNNLYQQCALNHFAYENIIRSLANYRRRSLPLDNFIDNYGRQNNLQGKAFLNAHRYGCSGTWYYCDSGHPRKVQDWVDSVDGTATVLEILVCNTENLSLSSSKSLIIHSRTKTSILDAVTCSNLRLYVPKEGYSDILFTGYEI